MSSLQHSRALSITNEDQEIQQKKKSLKLLVGSFCGAVKNYLKKTKLAEYGNVIILISFEFQENKSVKYL